MKGLPVEMTSFVDEKVMLIKSKMHRKRVDGVAYTEELLWQYFWGKRKRHFLFLVKSF